MRVGPLVFHVLYAVLGLVVLHTRSRLLLPRPVRALPVERLVSARLAEDTPVELRADTVLMSAGGASDQAGRVSVRRQLGQARSEARIDVPFQDFGGRVHVRIGVPRLQSGPHALLLRSASSIRITSRITSGPSAGGGARQGLESKCIGLPPGGRSRSLRASPDRP